MPSMVVMRDYVSRQYGGSWPQKVARMPDYQVTALYFKFTDKEHALKQNCDISKAPKLNCAPGQLSMFDADFTVE